MSLSDSTAIRRAGNRLAPPSRSPCRRLKFASASRSHPAGARAGRRAAPDPDPPAIGPPGGAPGRPRRLRHPADGAPGTRLVWCQRVNPTRSCPGRPGRPGCLRRRGCPGCPGCPARECFMCRRRWYVPLAWHMGCSGCFFHIHGCFALDSSWSDILPSEALQSQADPRIIAGRFVAPNTLPLRGFELVISV